MPKRLSTLAGQLPVELIERRIYLIRGHKVMLDADLAELYQVTTKALNQAVRRNYDRFPRDFMFQLTTDENESLRSQTVTSNAGRGGRRYLPYAFTEHGALMLSSVLQSERAVQMSIRVVRVFIQLRDLLSTHKNLAARLEKLAAGQQKHGVILAAVVREIRELKSPPEASPKRRIGFVAD